MTRFCRLFALTAALLLSVGSPRGVRAYSTDNHQRITTLAIDLVQRCRVDGGALASVAERRGALQRCAEVVKQFNLGQDKPLEKLRQWHFPRPRDERASIAPKGCPPTTALDFICWFAHEPFFDEWVTKLGRIVEQTPVQPALLYPTLGAVLHYVQDLAVPAHAVPVFHPHGVLQPTDAFDDYAFVLPQDQLSCDELHAASSLRELLTQAHQGTLASLEQEIGVEPASRGGPRWSAFWRADIRNQDDARFGSYGCEQQFASGCDRNEQTSQVACGAQTLRIPCARYGAFASARARQAVLTSAAAILLFEQKLAAKPEPRCAPDDSARWFPSSAR